MQDSVPAESSIISKVLEANNKATGTHFTHLYVETKCKQNVHAFCHERSHAYWREPQLWQMQVHERSINVLQKKYAMCC